MHKFYKRTFLLLILLFLIILPAAGNMAQDGAAATGQAAVNLAPNATTLTTIPAKPGFTWENSDLTVVQYRVFVWNSAHVAVVDELVDKGLHCLTEGIDFCGFYSNEYTLPAWGLVDGNYEWWVGAKFQDNTWAWSAKATFTVDVPAPSLPANIYIYTYDGRPIVFFDLPSYTFWEQIWIGPNPAGAYSAWHEYNGDGKNFQCIDVCWIIPDWDVPSHNATGSPYNMTVWMRSWGPGGYSSGGVSGWSQLSTVNGDPATTFQFPQSPAPTPSGLVQSGGTVLDPGFTWTGGPGTTWYNLALAATGTGTVVHNSWHLAATLNSVIACPGAMSGNDYTCAVSGLGLNGKLTSGAQYTPYVRGWGPGGMGAWHAGTPFIYNPL